MSTGSDVIVEWLRERLAAARSNGFVVGLSGGIDSAVVARLCQQAAPGRVVGVVMPCHSDPQDEADALVVARAFELPTVRIDLASPYDRFTATLTEGLASLPSDIRSSAGTEATDLKARVPLANVKPRMRMATLYFIANSLNYLVVGTGNRSELTIGYFTKYGDGGVDLLPIGGLLKSEVREMARALDVPAAVIEKPPSAGLWLGQTDESEMGFTYADLESYLTKGPQTVAPAVGLKIERLIRNSDHKRALAPTPGTGDQDH